jgi:bifunctional non-homologous end joining protein LigD
VRERALKKPAARKAADRSRKSPAGLSVAGVPGARRAALPTFVEPELCTLVDEAPRGDDWIHEIKFDGYRIVARLEAGRVRLMSRNGKDWTARFRSIADAVARLPATRAVLDGEVCVVGHDGLTSFQSLQNALGREEARNLTYFLFDLVYLDGFDLAAVPLLERKKLLAWLLAKKRSDELVFSDHVEGGGEAFYRKACEHGLEGVISKLASSPYRQLRSREWRKTKCLLEQEFVIAGYTDGTGTRTGFGALLLGVQEKGHGLRYAGKVGTGFTETTLRELSAKLARIERARAPFAEVPAEARRGVHWVEPKLVAEVAFLGWTRDGRLRHPSFHGLREDRAASEVVRERPVDLPASMPDAREQSVSKRKPTAPPVRDAAAAKKRVSKRVAASPRSAATDKRATSSKEAARVRVAGIAISNPSKVLYPDPGITKGEIAEYYEKVAPWMLPHVANRPLTLLRCPDGYDGECFFQKNAAGLPDAVDRVEIPDLKGGKPSIYGVVRDASGIVALLQMGVLEIHVWGSTAANLERPDRIVFDLDPDPGVSWDDVVDSARFVRATLAKLGLASHAMMTGGKGIHVVLHVDPEYDWPIVKEFAHAVVKTIMRNEPGRYVDVASKKRREGKIFLDYLRNGRGATAVAPYSTRSRPGARVAVPIDWKELDSGLRSDAFDVRTVLARLSRMRTDPWKIARPGKPLAAAGQSLRRALEGAKKETA